jgi:hypothetical protein
MNKYQPIFDSVDGIDTMVCTLVVVFVALVVGIICEWLFNRR